ncbi:MAG: DMT family transporter [Coriobacteriia bacterium]|nr:DMT family transporter [Coriobacteriia bacterium]
MPKHTLQARARYVRLLAHKTKRHPRFSSVAPALALLLIAVVWGSTFVLMADAIAQYPMYAFLAMRFGIATIVLVLLRPDILRKMTAENVKLGLSASIFLALGYILQTASLLPAEMGGTTPARSAFLTGVYVILVPIAQSAMRKRLPNWGVRLGVIFAVGGLWALSGLNLSDGGLVDWVLGDTLVLMAAFAYTAHMIILGLTSRKHSTTTLAVIQLGVVAMVSAFGSIITGEAAGLPQGQMVWFAILVTGILGSSLAFVVQTWAQKLLSPARVALILVLEPVFGGIFGWSAAGTVPGRELLGAVLLIGGMISAEAIATRRSNGDNEEDLVPALEGMPVVVKADDKDTQK